MDGAGQLVSVGRVPSKKTEGSVLFVDSFRVRLTMTSCDVTWREPVLEPHQLTENERQDNSYSDHESVKFGTTHLVIVISVCNKHYNDMAIQLNKYVLL